MMSSVVAFPRMPHVGSDAGTPIEVIVAPLGETMVAWVRTARGCAVLERSPDWRHALSDGRAYASRHGVPLRMQRTPLDTSCPERGEPRGGTISVEPSDRDGGSWDIVHLDHAHDVAGIVGNAFSFEEAEAEARRIAARIGAVYAGPSAGIGGAP